MSSAAVVIGALKVKPFVYIVLSFLIVLLPLLSHIVFFR